MSTTAKPVDSWNACLNTSLEQEDPEMFRLVELEKYRQYSCLELIASENFTSQAVMEANGSPLTNKYSEGLPGARYYGGNEYIDQVENLCRTRALAAFELDPAVWGVNVQPYSGSTANFSALTAMLAPHDRIMVRQTPGWEQPTQVLPSLQNIEVDGVKIAPPTQIPWYPEQLAYPYDASRTAIRKSPALKRFHQFLTSESEIGNISRQEAVSMIPPLLLDVQPHHHVLDMFPTNMSTTAKPVDSWNACLNTSLEQEDPEMFRLVELEKYRQYSCLELIAFGKLSRRRPYGGHGSPLTNKYSEVDMKTGVIDYDRLEQNAALFRPKLVICGASAYARDWDYERLRKVADQHGAFLMADMAHISGLIAAHEQKSPFELADVVTTTTHKTLRGPRAGLIFFRKVNRDGSPTDLESRVNMAVFPSNQGGPHNNTIAAVAVALKQVATPAFRQYAQQVRKNAAALANALTAKGYKMVTGGTDNHLVLWDLRPVKLTGSKLEKICDLVNITLNKNAVHGDTSALSPGGVRVGAPALTSRSFKEADFVQVAEFLHRAVLIALKIQDAAGSKMMKVFSDAVDKGAAAEDIKILKKEIEAFARSFPMPGFNPATIKYKEEH
ncbi:hypothetical protein AMAG_03416 [Allomyces macrogynus ATCC 38327]|uniref:Serine hydroxymethyltransferase n=1 Tax=Allomyces macrogynus (strain ATCC 38327) TaxID=578462 RepID=A0A0L0S920_ALLM3|nr:hypothetical protein AMAG_03416 [Allomyces macrogynus ATCC 38327]|eukprot:KNE59068.1 hypothetical protein AMAG_03416 [Allomyces macrogynus ATCC 38327]